MPPSLQPGPRRVLLLGLATLFLLTGLGCEPDLPASGSALFTSPQVNPVALSPDGQRLWVANTTSGSVSLVDVSDPAAPLELAEIHVGLDPVGIAVRPAPTADGDELVLISNHISDSVSVVSTRDRALIQTVQEFDADGLTTTDAPTGISFAGPDRAFVALEDRNEVLVLDLAPDGHVSIAATRLAIRAQAPRALTVAGAHLYVAAFESMNQTEFPTCAPGDPRGLELGNPHDQGCEFILDNATIGSFVGDPNIGGRVIRDGDLPDRDVFVFDTATLNEVAVVEGVGTLLYGMAGAGDERIYVSNTEARNNLNGLAALGNRMFENRITRIDCAGGACSAPVVVDLDQSAGEPIPTPYGVAVSDNGDQLVVTGSGSDGPAAGGIQLARALLPAGAPLQELPGLAGLAVLDADGNVLGSLPVGAIPQGVALRSDAAGDADFAFVLNTVDSSLASVDVRDPANPTLRATLPVGSDPTPAAVKRGRIAFSSARASSSGTFSCESCHPNGNSDQLLWTINTSDGPDDPPAANGVVAEPRTTMPVRGLRDTLPLHWDGSLGDPFPGVFTVGDTAPDCDPAANGDSDCTRHLADASLGGVMCAQDQASACAVGPSGLPGLLTQQERDDLAVFLLAVAYPPSPRRRPDDALSPLATQGASDFFTPLDFTAGLGTCANAPGCHALPLTVGTNSGVGGFDAPSIRGIWDRSILFSNGFAHSEEGLTLWQACADGSGPFDPCGDTPASGDQVWDPALGMTESGSMLAGFNPLFTAIYGVPGDGIWAFLNEMSVGFPGLLGRQFDVEGDADGDPVVAAHFDQLEGAAHAGKLTAVGRGADSEYRYDAELGQWLDPGGVGLKRHVLLEVIAASGRAHTFTAEVPGQVAADTPQPIVWPDPPMSALGNFPNVPLLSGGSVASFSLACRHLQPGAAVLVNGSVCDGCAATLLPPPGAGEPERVAITLDPVPPAAGDFTVHVLQLQNPEGLASNELPLIVTP